MQLYRGPNDGKDHVSNPKGAWLWGGKVGKGSLFLIEQVFFRLLDVLVSISYHPHLAPIETIHDGSDPAPTPKGAWPGAKKGV